jgi:hypothetical protein
MHPSRNRLRPRWILLGAAYLLLIACAALIGIKRGAPEGKGKEPAPRAGAGGGAAPASGAGAPSPEADAPGGSPGKGVALSLRLIDASSGEPLAGLEAGVTLRNGSRSDARSVVTDEAGAAEIHGAAPGRHSVEVHAAGFIPARHAIEIAGERPSAEVRLSRGAVLEGDVLDAAGAPLAGARIRAFRIGAEGPEGASASAGSDGAFALKGLRPGDWRVTAVKEGFRARTIDAPAPGERLLIELAKDPGFEAIVLGPDGSPVAGARVSVLSRTGGSSAGARSGETGAEGCVRLAGLPSDPDAEIAVEARHRDHLPARVARKGADLERAPLTIRFARGGEIAGRVVDARGAPVPNAEVSILVPGERSRRSLRTISTGEFLFRKLPAGSHDLAATSPSGGAGLLRGIAVSEGGAARGIEVVLDAGPGVVAGRIVDRAGKGVALAPVEIALEGGAAEAARRTVSGEGGAFRFEGLPLPAEGGAYRVRAGGGKLSAADMGGVRAGEEALEVIVERLGSIRGLIDSSEPVEGYSIRATRAAAEGGKAFERTFRFTSRDLWFHLRGLSPGTYDLTLLIGREPRAAVHGVTVAAGTEAGPVEMKL